MVDTDKMKDAIRTLIVAVGRDPKEEGLKDTPQRVADFWVQWEKETSEPIDVFFAEEYSGMVIVRDIPFFSFCEHHILPFYGSVSVGYIPAKDKVLGVSKLVRIVRKCSFGLQLQERLTEMIAKELESLGLAGGIVVVKATHLCMVVRGVKVNENTKMVTSSIFGAFTDLKARSEFLALLQV